jgi:succinate dehydrogenase / fumarate reductase cytochrome b subunit
MASSIFHRASGVALYAGALGLALWLSAAAFAPEQFATLQGLLANPLGQLALYAMAAAFCYHLANGIRHLVWDLGHGLEPKAANASAWAVIAFGALAPAIFWVLAAMKGG